MSNFKRNSSRFSRGGSSNEGSGSSEGRSSRGSSRGGDSEGGSSRSSGRSGGRSGGGGGNGKYAFSRIGSLTVPKKVPDEVYDWIVDNLRGNEEVRLALKIYPPKGVQSVTLNRDDLVVLSFKVSDKDKDFVMGHASIPNDSE